MLPNINYYPIALIAIIGGALYFLLGGVYKAGSIDLGQYQQVCEQYLAAGPAEVSREAMQSLIYKVNYLLPSPVNELSDPLEKAVKTCAQALNKRLTTVVEVE